MRRLLLLLFVFGWSMTATSFAAERPNVLVIVADDLGYADVGFHGCRDIPTPHLDALAAGGVRCSSGYVSGPYCSPTRAGLLTGRYQTRFGHEFNPSAAGAGLPTTEVTIANRLKSAGYATGLVGKWHLGSQPEQRPLRRGFDEFFGFLGGAHDYFNDQGILRGDQQVKEPDYLTDAFGREAVAFIDRHAKEPFFLYLAFNAVHTPLEAPAEREAKFSTLSGEKRRTYAAMLSAEDDAIGRVVQKLRDAKIEENTLIFFISDNGGPVMQGTSINGSINAPLRGSKRTTLEGGVRVPFAVSWKGHLPAGLTYDKPVIQLDILPTVLAAAGVDSTSEKPLDGVNLLPYLNGENAAAPHDALYWRFGEQMAIRRGDWKLVRYDSVADGDTSRGLRRNMAAIHGPKLYNLAADIGESNDLATQQPDKVTELQTAWDAWNRELVKPLWGPGAAGKANDPAE